jgi:hypothetical protein
VASPLVVGIIPSLPLLLKGLRQCFQSRITCTDFLPIRFHEIFNNHPSFGGNGNLETILIAMNRIKILV